MCYSFVGRTIILNFNDIEFVLFTIYSTGLNSKPKLPNSIFFLVKSQTLIYYFSILHKSYQTILYTSDVPEYIGASIVFVNEKGQTKMMFSLNSKMMFCRVSKRASIVFVNVFENNRFSCILRWPTLNKIEKVLFLRERKHYCD